MGRVSWIYTYVDCTWDSVRLVTLKPVIGVRVLGQVALRFLCRSGACLTDVMSCNSGCDLMNLDR